MRIKWWLLFIRGVNSRRDIQLEKIVSEYDAKGGGRERELRQNLERQNVSMLSSLATFTPFIFHLQCAIAYFGNKPFQV